MWSFPLAPTTMPRKGTGDTYAKDWSQRECGQDYISIGLARSQQALHLQGAFIHCACHWTHTATFCAMKPLLGWPAAQTLQRRSDLRHFETNHMEKHQYFKATCSPEGQRQCNANAASQLWRELALNSMDAKQFVPLSLEARV